MTRRHMLVTMTRQRARSDEDKQARRAAILDAARDVFDATEFDAFTMDAVAAELGLVKGTLYRYFPTREGLLLAVIDDEFRRWFDAVDAELDPSRGGTDAVVDVLVRAILDRPRFMRLLSLLPTVMERNVPYDTAVAFKTMIVARTGSTADLVGRRLGVPADRAVRLLKQLQASLIGLYHHAHPSPIMQQLADDPAFATLRLDLPTELRHATAALVAAALA